MKPSMAPLQRRIKGRVGPLTAMILPSGGANLMIEDEWLLDERGKSLEQKRFRRGAAKECLPAQTRVPSDKSHLLHPPLTSRQHPDLPAIDCTHVLFPARHIIASPILRHLLFIISRGPS